jgi:hypothetical protein
MEARLIGYARRDWYWEHECEERGLRRGGPFASHIEAFNALIAKCGHTTAVEQIRKQVRPTASECARAAAEHGFPGSPQAAPQAAAGGSSPASSAGGGAGGSTSPVSGSANSSRFEGGGTRGVASRVMRGRS